MDWLDLSHPMWDDMPRPGFAPPPRIQPLMELGADPFNVMEYTFITHLGTHVDAPRHFYAEGATIDQLPLDRFVGPGVVLNVQGRPCQAITASQLADAGPSPKAGDIVLIGTGWEAKFGSREYMAHPYLHQNAADWLVEHGVKLVGMDLVTPEMPVSVRSEGFRWPIHRALLSRGILVAENVRNLGAVGPQTVEVVAAPINIRGGDGAPVRILARPT